MKLFEPLTINGLEIKNRIVMPAMQLQLGLTNRRARAFYLARARGGVGAMIMCATSVDFFIEDAAWGRPNGVALFIERMKIVNEEIRQAGSKIGIQLWHGNQWPAGSGMPMPGAEQVAPSARDDRRELTVGEIERIIEKFARASAGAKAAGFDFVEIHGAHGYLVCQFFSGADNQRTDQYGGSLEGRMRFGLELVRAMRRAVGENYPIVYRMGAEEKRLKGITLRQSRKFAVQLEKAGVDAFDISIGLPGSKGALNASPGPRAKMGTLVPLAEAIKKEVTVPVMGVGRINRPEVAEAILQEGRADWIGIARQLIADPEWPNKVAQGLSDTIVACKSCNSCFRPFIGNGKWRPGDPLCKVNPWAGREADLVK
jgi:2,4-dienoyl-CoA reductase-like NADH-dependent reductase (Old Yellow Enzyme family)